MITFLLEKFGTNVIMSTMRFHETPGRGLSRIERELSGKSIKEKGSNPCNTKAKLQLAVRERIGIQTLLEVIDDRKNRSLSPGVIFDVDARDSKNLKRRLAVVNSRIGGLTRAYNRLQNS